MYPLVKGLGIESKILFLLKNHRETVYWILELFLVCLQLNRFIQTFVRASVNSAAGGTTQCRHVRAMVKATYFTPKSLFCLYRHYSKSPLKKPLISLSLLIVILSFMLFLLYSLCILHHIHCVVRCRLRLWIEFILLMYLFCMCEIL